MIPSRSASDEMIKHGLTLDDIIEILSDGYDCSSSKRKKNTIEKCLDKKGKTRKAVIVQTFNYSFDAEVWLVTHLGITSKRR